MPRSSTPASGGEDADLAFFDELFGLAFAGSRAADPFRGAVLAAFLDLTDFVLDAPFVGFTDEDFFFVAAAVVAEPFFAARVFEPDAAPFFPVAALGVFEAVPAEATPNRLLSVIKVEKKKTGKVLNLASRRPVHAKQPLTVRGVLGQSGAGAAAFTSKHAARRDVIQARPSRHEVSAANPKPRDAHTRVDEQMRRRRSRRHGCGCSARSPD